MGKNNYGWVTPVIVLGGLALGGYLLYNWWKNNPISKALDTAGAPGLIPGVVPAVNLYTAIMNPNGTITPQNVTQVSADLGKTGANTNPWNMLNDPWGWAFNAFGQLPNMISAVKLAGGTAATPSPQTNAAIVANNASTAAVRRSIPVTVTRNTTTGAQVGTYAALNTNLVGGWTAPTQQVSNYQVAPKIVKVDGISREVM